MHVLTRKAEPNQVRWTPEAEAAFQDLRGSICQDPVLATPDFKLPFTSPRMERSTLSPADAETQT